MENVETMMDPEVVETAVEGVGIDMNPENLSIIGLAFAAGCVVAIPAYNYVVKPLVNKIKDAVKNRRKKTQVDEEVEYTFVEED